MSRLMVSCIWMVWEDYMDGNGCLYSKRFQPLYLVYFATLYCLTTQKRHHVRHLESLTGFMDLTLFSAYDSLEWAWARNYCTPIAWRCWSRYWDSLFMASSMECLAWLENVHVLCILYTWCLCCLCFSHVYAKFGTRYGIHWYQCSSHVSTTLCLWYISFALRPCMPNTYIASVAFFLTVFNGYSTDRFGERGKNTECYVIWELTSCVVLGFHLAAAGYISCIGFILLLSLQGHGVVALYVSACLATAAAFATSPPMASVSRNHMCKIT